MNVKSINSCSFSDQKKDSNKTRILYPISQVVGSIIGYSIPLKEIDGPDIVSSINSSKKLVMMKTRVPNELGKWKNALAGAFVGTAIAMLIDYLLKKNKQ